MNIDFTQKSGPNLPIYEDAVSICLYRSSELSWKKHVEPLLDYLDQTLSYDLLVFCEEEFIPLFADHPNVRVFLVTSSTPGYYRHLWRYFGANFASEYTNIWYRGADTPDPFVNEIAEQAAELINAQVICWPRLHRRFYEFMGQCRLDKVASESLLAYLTCIYCNPAREGLWTIDEHKLSEWWSRHMHEFRTVVVLSRELDQAQPRAYLNHLLTIGCRSIVLKNATTPEPSTGRWL